jgi:hypothetical protein
MMSRFGGTWRVLPQASCSAWRSSSESFANVSSRAMSGLSIIQPAEAMANSCRQIAWWAGKFPRLP